MKLFVCGLNVNDAGHTAVTGFPQLGSVVLSLGLLQAAASFHQLVGFQVGHLQFGD